MRRYERASTLPASNHAVKDCGKLPGDVAAVAAMPFCARNDGNQHLSTRALGESAIKNLAKVLWISKVKRGKARKC
jgi:hypothetical protein